MKIRTVTLFSDVEDLPSNTEEFFDTARHAFHVPVQSTRLATSPFPGWWNISHYATFQAQEIAEQCEKLGADYISLGPVQLRHDASWLNLLPEIVGCSESLFVSAEIADRSGHIDLGRCHAAAEIIKRLSILKANGFKNLFFAAIANCPPGSPFFPVAYHDGGPAHFAIAVEAADIFQESIASAGSLSEARVNLVAAIERESEALERVAKDIASRFEISFRGIDFCPAPFPVSGTSTAAALESLGVPMIGAPGSLFGAAFLAEVIDRARFPRCGFSGLMLTVLEDSVLAERAGEGCLSVGELLSFAAVCGIGLDTVPLPGDIKQDTLAAILMDVGALAVRLNKPLTARLLPLPGLKSGDRTQFDFEYFADGQVMPIIDEGLAGLMSKLARLHFEPVHNKNRGDSSQIRTPE